MIRYVECYVVHFYCKGWMEKQQEKDANSKLVVGACTLIRLAFENLQLTGRITFQHFVVGGGRWSGAYARQWRLKSSRRGGDEKLFGQPIQCANDTATLLTRYINVIIYLLYPNV